MGWVGGGAEVKPKKVLECVCLGGLAAACRRVVRGRLFTTAAVTRQSQEAKCVCTSIICESSLCRLPERSMPVYTTAAVYVYVPGNTQTNPPLRDIQTRNVPC